MAKKPNAKSSRTTKYKSTSKSKSRFWANWSKRTQILVFAIIFGVVGSAFLFASRAEKPGNIQTAQYEPGIILVGFIPGTSAKQQASAAAQVNAQVVDEIPQLHVKKLKVPEQAIPAVMKALQKQKNVAYVERNPAASAALTPSDPYYPGTGPISGGQWGMWRTKANKVWEKPIGFGSPSIVLAVIDSGVVVGHPDLEGQLVPGYNVLDKSTNTNDTEGHGTSVAGIIGAHTNNAEGVAGYCGGCRIMPVKVTNGSSAYNSDLSAGLIWAADNGARVANMSFAGPTSSSTLANAVSYARSKGVVFVAAAGNAGTSTVQYPAGYDGAIAVAASSNLTGDVLQGYSSYGSWVDISAPSGLPTTTAIDYNTKLPYGYSAVGGTSLASPAVVGIAGLLLSANPGLTGAQLEQALLVGADPITGDHQVATGLIDALDAYNGVMNVPVDTVKPTVSIASPLSGATVSGIVNVDVIATDDVGIASVTASIQNSTYITKVSATKTTSPYTFAFDVSSLVPGTYNLVATATDTYGNVKGTNFAITISSTSVADTTRPTLSLSAPVTGATVSGTVNLSATAADNVGVANTYFYIDGAVVASAAGNSLSYAWDTTTLVNGTHTFEARAYDAAGNVTSQTRTYTVANTAPTTDTTAPTIYLSGVSDGMVIPSTTSSIAITAAATDNIGVTGMTLSIDGRSKATSTTGSLNYTWNTRKLKSGNHPITVTASDAAGNKTSYTIKVVR